MGQMQGPRGRTLVIVRNVRNRTLCTATFEAFPLVFLVHPLTPSSLFIWSIVKSQRSYSGESIQTLLAASLLAAEGATAPETLRQPDRRGMSLWKAGGGCRLTEGENPTSARVNLSGIPTEGARWFPVRQDSGAANP